MPTRISLALGERRPLSRQTAWGCLSTNLALPGLGSLVAGRVTGYPQAALAFIGIILTAIFSFRFLLWFIANWARLHDVHADQLALMADLWRSLRWALLGMAIFGLGWLWALATSLHIISSARTDSSSSAPPTLPA